MSPDSDPDWFAECAIDRTGADLDPGGFEHEAVDFADLFLTLDDHLDHGSAFGHADNLAAPAASYDRAPSSTAPEWRWRDFEEVPVREDRGRSFHLAVSRRLTAWAARVLPVVDRPDYEELFGSELYELAQSGGGRRAQLAYAFRVLVRAPVLRRELRAPARERSW